MKIKCNDGTIREFIPAEKPMTRHLIEPKKAYCNHCKEEFTRQPSSEQKELWRKHSCKIGVKKKTKI